MDWKRFNGAIIQGEIADEVEQQIILEKKLGNNLTICIGTDSQVRGSSTEFATVIVFVREKRGGYMFIQKSKTYQQMSLKERMIQEVSKSVTCAYGLHPVFQKYNVNLEVHADINTDPNCKSHSALKEAMGYIVGMGYDFKAKPHAFASSYCADKVV